MNCKVCDKDYHAGCICGFCIDCIIFYGHFGCIQFSVNKDVLKQFKEDSRSSMQNPKGEKDIQEGK